MQPYPDLHFGALAIRNGFASSREIELALETQKGGPPAGSVTPLKLGEILVERGTLTRAQIDAVLEAQTRLREAATGPAAPVLFEEIAPSTLTQESGPAIQVNDQPLTQARTLQAGDRIRIGDAVLKFTGDSMDLVPGAAPAAAASPASVAVPAKPRLVEKILPRLRAIDGLVAKLPPAIHTQRKYVIAAVAVGTLAFLLPWRIAGNGNSILGIQGPGWWPFVLSLIPLALTLLSVPTEPFTKIERLAASSAAGLAFLIGLVKLFLAPSGAVSRGIGLWLWLPASAALLASVAFARAGGTGAVVGPTLGSRLWRTLSGFAGSVSGRRAKDLTAAIEQRDALLRKIGEAALAAHPSLPDAPAAVQAREALQAAGKDGDEGVKAKATRKAAEAKATRAFGKLARKAIDGGLAIPGHDATIAELRATEAKIQDLS